MHKYLFLLVIVISSYATIQCMFDTTYLKQNIETKTLAHVAANRNTTYEINNPAFSDQVYTLSFNAEGCIYLVRKNRDRTITIMLTDENQALKISDGDVVLLKKDFRDPEKTLEKIDIYNKKIGIYSEKISQLVTKLQNFSVVPKIISGNNTQSDKSGSDLPQPIHVIAHKNTQYSTSDGKLKLSFGWDGNSPLLGISLLGLGVATESCVKFGQSFSPMKLQEGDTVRVEAVSSSNMYFHDGSTLICKLTINNRDYFCWHRPNIHPWSTCNSQKEAEQHLISYLQENEYIKIKYFK